MTSRFSWRTTPRTPLEDATREELVAAYNDTVLDLRDALLQVESLRTRNTLLLETLEAERTAWSVKAAELYTEIDSLRMKLSV